MKTLYDFFIMAKTFFAFLFVSIFLMGLVILLPSSNECLQEQKQRTIPTQPVPSLKGKVKEVLLSSDGRSLLIHYENGRQVFISSGSHHSSLSIMTVKNER